MRGLRLGAGEDGQYVVGKEGGDRERHEHSRANTVTRRGEKTGERCVLGWDCWILEKPRNSQTHQILNSQNDHSNQVPAGAWPVPKTERMMRKTV